MQGRTLLNYETKRKLAHMYRKFGIFLIFILMFTVCCCIKPGIFLSKTNLVNIARQVTTVMMISMAECMVLINGTSDMSPGATVALAGVVAATVYKSTNSLTIAILVAIFIGATVGFINGFLITTFAMPPFITTLATQQSARGLALIYTGGHTVDGIGKIVNLTQDRWFGVPICVYILIVICALSYVLVHKTKYGRYLYAIGSNITAAKASGVNVKKVRLSAYVIGGCVVGLAAIIYASRVNSGQPAGGVGLEFQAITAAIIGGAGMTGGTGSVPGAIVGSLIIGMLNNILTLCGVTSYVQQVLYGCIIAIAVIIDTITKNYE